MKDLIERIKDHVLTLKSLYIPQPVRETIAEQINLDLDELQKLADKKQNNNLLDKIVDGKRVPIPYEPLGPKDLINILPQQEKENPYKITKDTPWWKGPYIRYFGGDSTVGPCNTEQASSSNQKPLSGTISFANGGYITANNGHTLKITSEPMTSVISGPSGNVIGTITSTNGGHISFRSSGEVLRPINAKDEPQQKLNITLDQKRIITTPNERLYVKNTDNGYKLDINGTNKDSDYNKLLDAIQQAMKAGKPEFEEEESVESQLERHFSNELARLKKLGTKESLKQIEELNKHKENFEKYRQEAVKDKEFKNKKESEQFSQKLHDDFVKACEEITEDIDGKKRYEDWVKQNYPPVGLE